MSDVWGTSNDNNETTARGSRHKLSLLGIITAIVGIIAIIGFGIAKLTTVPVVDATANTGFDQFIPIAGIALGFILVFIGFRAINKARGRKGLN